MQQMRFVDVKNAWTCPAICPLCAVQQEDCSTPEVILCPHHIMSYWTQCSWVTGEAKGCWVRVGMGMGRHRSPLHYGIRRLAIKICGKFNVGNCPFCVFRQYITVCTEHQLLCGRFSSVVHESYKRLWRQVGGFKLRNRSPLDFSVFLRYRRLGRYQCWHCIFFAQVYDQLLERYRNLEHHIVSCQ